MKFKIVLILSIVLMLFTTSCSYKSRAQWHLNRALMLHPSILKADTVLKDTFVYVENTKFDTTLLFSKITDTVTITKDRVKTKIIRIHDTLKVETEHLGDTIYIQIPCVEKTILKDIRTGTQKFNDKLLDLFFELWWLLLLLLFSAYMYFKLRNKK